MVRFAFNTTACPEWTLERVAAAAAEYGYAGVELRSFGAGSTEIACDPALTDGMKVQRLFDDAGVDPIGVASGVRFDAPVRPPVLGHADLRNDASIHEGRHMVDVAVACQARYVRVYGYEVGKGERYKAGARRVIDRLRRVVDHAWNRDVEVLLENGGTFSKAEEIAEIIDAVRSPILGACYDLGAAHAAGDDIERGIETLGPMLRAARVRDRRADETCMIGDGEMGCREFVRALKKSPSASSSEIGGLWVVFSWDRMWRDGLAPAEEALPEAVKRLSAWAAEGSTAGVAA